MKGFHLPSSSKRILGGMECENENRVIGSKFGKNGQNKLFMFLVNPTPIQL
jgi:hypothetical protein